MTADTINDQLQLYFKYILLPVGPDWKQRSIAFMPDTSDLLKKLLALRQQQIKQWRQKVYQTHIISLYLSTCFNLSGRSICLMVRNIKTPDCPSLNCQLIAKQLRNPSVLLCVFTSVWVSVWKKVQLWTNKRSRASQLFLFLPLNR